MSAPPTDQTTRAAAMQLLGLGEKELIGLALLAACGEDVELVHYFESFALSFVYYLIVEFILFCVPLLGELS